MKQFFLNYRVQLSDFTVVMSDEHQVDFHDARGRGLEVTFAETGLDTATGARLRRIRHNIDAEDLMMGYGDGIGAVDLEALEKEHWTARRIGAVTGVHPTSKFGEMKMPGDKVIEFNEKPTQVSGFVSGGFFMFRRRFLDDYLDDDANLGLESEPLQRLSRDGELPVYQHRGFWRAMDTYKDYRYLNDLWAQGEAPWRVWLCAPRRAVPVPPAAGDDGLLEGDLRAVREARDHVRVLGPAFGGGLLRGGRAVRVMQALDVAGDQGPDAQAPDEPQEVGSHPWLVTVGRAEDDAGLSRAVCEHRSHRTVQLGVHRHHRHAALDGRHGHAPAELHGARELHDSVQPVGGQQGEGVLQYGRRPGPDRPLQLRCRGYPNRFDARLPVGPFSVRERAVRDCHQAHPGHRVDVVGQCAAHRAGAHHAEPDGTGGDGAPGRR